MTEVIVALDVSTPEQAEAITTPLRGVIRWYKVGLQFFIAHGARAVEVARRGDARVFLDLKLHDIPQTVANAVAEAGRLGVDSVSLHLSGGAAMLQAAAAVKDRPRLWGVSVLTSMTDDDVKVLGRSSAADLVEDLARLGASNGVDGIVCSGQELERLGTLQPRPHFVVPGIRGPGDPVGDQKRTMTPAEARNHGADFIVVGRPITRAPDPVAAARRILEELSKPG